MKYLLILLMLALVVISTGCATTYRYQNGDQVLEIKTYREFPGGIDVEYGDFKVKTGEVTNGNDAWRDVILSIIPLIPVPGK